VSSTLFISDLHLDAARPEATVALAALLAKHEHCDALYILGDLFEAWIGDDDDTPLALDTCTLLRAFSDTGPALYLMQGNRDFLLGERFASRAGAILLPDPTVIDLYGQATLLMHGDTLCTGDTDYQTFRTLVHKPQWQAEALNLPLTERREMASQLRGMSKDANSNKAQDIVDVTVQEVIRAMKQHGVKQLIHGHTHRPARHDVETGTRWVLGDWGEQAWIASASPTGMDLYKLY
jgi:UDP-2,3-diacylglucosamine hydrolase